MKKLLAMLLALVMVLSFAACGNTEPEVDEPEVPSEPEVETPEEPEVTEATYTLGLGVVVNQTVVAAHPNARFVGKLLRAAHKLRLL